MGEEFVSESLSRFDMSYFTFRQLQRDHINFEESYADKFENGFICQILINYMSYAQENFCIDFEAAVENILKNREREEYSNGARITFTKALADKMGEFEFTNRDDFKKRPVITYILKSFAALRISEREKIFNRQVFKTIENAISDNELLYIKNSAGFEFDVKPYSIDVDDNSGSYYLIGYSRRKSSDKDYECRSFKLSRIRICKSRYIESALSVKEIRNAKEICEKFGCAYMTGNLSKNDIERSVVRLSTRGYKELFLKVIARQRPIPVAEPKTVHIGGEVFYELEFDCSYRQISNYFFSFGNDAEIVSPLRLRERFIDKYSEALGIYRSEKDEQADINMEKSGI